MKVSLKKPMSTDTQYSSNFQPILERVRCWIVSKPIEGNCQLVDRCRSSFVGGANLMAHASDVDGNTVLDLGDHPLTCSSPRCSYKHRRVNGKVVMMNPSLSNSIRGFFPRAALLACTLGIPVLATATQPPSLTSPNAAQHSLSGGRERSPLIDKVRNATARFRDINALSNDWVRATPCVSGPNEGAALLDRIVNHQAQITAYNNVYVLLIMATIPAWMLLMLMRLPRKMATAAG